MIDLAGYAKSQPFLIFENGGGVAWPTGYFVREGDYAWHGYHIEILGDAYTKVREHLVDLRQTGGFKFRGFGDMAPEQVVGLTGLARADAVKAQQRLTSEPVLWEDDDRAMEQFTSRLAGKGLTLQLGGRFQHVSAGSSKLQALRFLRQQICYERGLRPKVLACGDAPNDMDLIDRADHALVFPGPDGSYLRDTRDTVAHAPVAGPRDWLSGVQGIVDAPAEAVNE
jgi:mannosyl-3-phosphoglycerate phosphatase